MVRQLTINPFTALLALWGSFIIYGTAVPFDFSVTWPEARLHLSGIRMGYWGVTSTSDMVANLLLFLPWGFLLAVRLSQAHKGFFVAVAVATGTGCLLSISVESLQLFSASRVANPRDVMLNTASAFLGVLLGWAVAQFLGPVIKAKQDVLVNERPLAGLAAVTTLIFLGFSLEPFDFAVLLTPLKEGIQNARLIPFGATLLGNALPPEPWMWTIDLLRWAFLGGIFALALRERGFPRFAVLFAAAALCGLLGSVFEMMQLLVVSQHTDATTAVLALAGGLFGAGCIAFGWTRAPRDWAVVALGLWSFVLVLTRWTPSQFSPVDFASLTLMSLFPLLAYTEHPLTHVMADVFNGGAPYIILGALLAAQFSSWNASRTVIAAVGLSISLETGQLFLDRHLVQITDVLWAGVGTYLGMWLWKLADRDADEDWSEDVPAVAEPSIAIESPVVERARVIRPTVVRPHEAPSQVVASPSLLPETDDTVESDELTQTAAHGPSFEALESERDVDTMITTTGVQPLGAMMSPESETPILQPDSGLPQSSQTPVIDSEVPQSSAQPSIVREASHPPLSDFASIDDEEERSIQVMPGYLIHPRPYVPDPEE